MHYFVQLLMPLEHVVDFHSVTEPKVTMYSVCDHMRGV